MFVIRKTLSSLMSSNLKGTFFSIEFFMSGPFFDNYTFWVSPLLKALRLLTIELLTSTVIQVWLISVSLEILQYLLIFI